MTNLTTYRDVNLKITGHEQWRPGYVYCYQADLTPGEHYIQFSASVNSWVDDGDRDQTINPTNPTQGS